MRIFRPALTLRFRDGFVAVALLLLAASPAFASIEDFETWDVGAQEGDDEYGLDSFFLSFSPEWETDWLFSREGARSSMGSSVNEVWEMRNEFRLRRDLNPRLRFEYGFVQNQGLTINDEQHSLGIQMERGGFWFGPFARPNSSKEHLDAGLVVKRSWRTGTEVRLSVSFEDWNSDHTNLRSASKARTLVDFIDPAREWRIDLRQRWSRSRWLAAEGAWLPEFRRHIDPRAVSADPDFFRFTNGYHWRVRGQGDPWPGLSLELLAERKEARRADFPLDTLPAQDYRRNAWKVRTRLTHRLAAGFLGRWGLQFREGNERDAAGGADPYRMKLDDVVVTAGARRRLANWITMELGYGHQETDVAQGGPKDRRRFSWGSRTENRLYLVAEFEASGLRCRLIETVELDDEGYGSFSEHDKGFVQLQAVF